MAHEPEITSKEQRPFNIRDESDMSPGNMEKMLLWLDKRLNGIEVQVADLESRITTLETP